MALTTLFYTKNVMFIFITSHLSLEYHGIYYTVYLKSNHRNLLTTYKSTLLQQVISNVGCTLTYDLFGGLQPVMVLKEQWESHWLFDQMTFNGSHLFRNVTCRQFVYSILFWTCIVVRQSHLLQKYIYFFEN